MTPPRLSLRRVMWWCPGLVVAHHRETLHRGQRSPTCVGLPVVLALTPVLLGYLHDVPLVRLGEFRRAAVANRATYSDGAGAQEQDGLAGCVGAGASTCRASIDSRALHVANIALMVVAIPGRQTGARGEVGGWTLALSVPPPRSTDAAPTPPTCNAATEGVWARRV